MTFSHDRRGPGSFERPTLRRIYEPKSPRMLAENVVVCALLGLAAGISYAVVFLF